MTSLRRFAQWRWLLVLAVLLSLAACGGGLAPTDTPAAVAIADTDTPIPPTDTPIPPIDTPVLPTDTPLPPTDTPIPPTDSPAPPTATPKPTDTPEPTETPEPTASPTQEASPVPEPTNTPKPTTAPKLGKILFTSNRASWDDCFVMNEDGTNVKQLTTIGRCYSAHFSPDGKRIVFDHEADIYIMNADGSGVTNLTNSGDKIEAFPVFSSNGKRIAFLFG
jgi:predicted small lipoprotein YifL